MRNDLALGDIFRVFALGFHNLKAGVLGRLACIIHGHVLEVGRVHGIGPHGNGEGDGRPLLLLGAAGRVLLQHRALVDGFVFLGRNLHLEAGLLQREGGLLLGVAHHAGDLNGLVGRGRRLEAARYRERDAGHQRDGQNGAEGDDDGFLALLRVGIVEVRRLEIARGARRHGRRAAGNRRHNLGARHARHRTRHRAHHAGLGLGERRAHRASRQGDGASGQVVHQRDAHVVSRGEATRRILRKGHHDDVLKVGIDVRVDGRGGRRFVLHLLHGH